MAADSWLDFFEVPAPRFDQVGFRYAPGVAPRDYGLRWYQHEAKAAAEDALSRVRSALVVKATGLGKSRTLAAIAGDWTQGDVLVLAHRDELIQQNANTLELVTGEMVEIEQADMRASARCRIVMGSVQSVCRDNRLERMGKDRFGLVIVDEAHHATSPSYRKILDWFGDAKILGVTATPDRSDEKALGQIFDEVAYVMDISDGIEQGYLVPIRGHAVEVREIDLSGIDTQAGDLMASQLDEAMVKAVEGIVQETVRLFPNRRGPAFFPGVKSAELACQRFNALRPGSACFLHAKTPDDERAEMTRDIKAGRYQYFCNVGIACLDAETELLTSDGWVGAEDIAMTHKLANWWPDGTIDFSPPLGIERRARRVDEDMYSTPGDQLRMRVTQDHRVPHWGRSKGPLRVGRAWELRDFAMQIPLCGDAVPTPVALPPLPILKGNSLRRLAANTYNLRKKGVPPDLALQEAKQRIEEREALKYTPPGELTISDCHFIGFWLGDGGCCELQSGGVEFSLHNDKSTDAANRWIESVLAAIGVDYVRREKPATFQWSIGRGTGFGPQRRRGVFRLEPYLSKSGSDLFWALTRDQLIALLQGFWMADGDHGKASAPTDGTMRISNTNRPLLDLLQGISVCRGLSARLRWRSNGPRSAPLGKLTVSRSRIHRCAEHKSLQRETIWRDEMVWCVKSRSSFIVARRGGTVFVTGNTEGFDWPEADIVIGGRPTKSRSLACQMAGRGTRVLPGTVDHIHGKDGAARRREAVAGSLKPDLILLDFCGNGGRHSLIGPEDILGGDFTEAEVALAKKKGKDSPGGNTAALLAAARAELQALASRIRGTVKSSVSTFDPFGAFGIDRKAIERINTRFGYNPASQKQRDALKRLGVPAADLEAISRQAASKMLEVFGKRIEKGLASFNQLAALRKWGVAAPNEVSFASASACLDYLKTNRGNHDARRIDAILHGQREPGVD